MSPTFNFYVKKKPLAPSLVLSVGWVHTNTVGMVPSGKSERFLEQREASALFSFLELLNILHVICARMSGFKNYIILNLG